VVPGDGRITSVTIRSGPTPAPLSLVILRQLSTSQLKGRSSPGGGDKGGRGGAGLAPGGKGY